ncbi:MAG: hypothetical protein AAGH82_06780, partial [Pseudomonadota bacterium]
MTDSNASDPKAANKPANKPVSRKMTREDRAALVAQMLANKKGGKKPVATKSASFDWAALPEIKKAALQKKVAQSVGLGNPYMRHTADSGAAVVEINGKSTVNFCSYDYISVGEHADVREAARAAVDHYGTSANASRLVSGERTIHGELEAALAE